MSTYDHILITFDLWGKNRDKFYEESKDYIDKNFSEKKLRHSERNVPYFLDFIKEGKGKGLGPKGDRFSWSIMGMNVYPEQLMTSLYDFFIHLMKGFYIGNVVNIMINREECLQTEVYTIIWHEYDCLEPLVKNETFNFFLESAIEDEEDLDGYKKISEFVEYDKDY